MEGSRIKRRNTLGTAAAAAGIICMTFAVFTGCSRAAGGEGIWPADLTQKEQELVKLYGGDANSHIFDFSAKDSLTSASVRLKILNANGQWMDHGRAVLSSEDDNGRILVTSADGWQTVRMALQDSEGMDSVSFQPGEQELDSRMMVSQWLAEETPIESGQEIPLLIHVESGQTEIETYGMSAFEDPSILAGHDRVFAVTITFSEP